jgi:hypothetical protein
MIRVGAKSLSRILLFLLQIALLVPVVFSAHASFINGDFESGTTGWNDASSTGTTGVVGGSAQLDTGIGSDAFSAILVQGDDGFFTFSSPITLAADVVSLDFDVSFINTGPDQSETGTSFFFTDHLIIALYDALDFSYDMFYDPIDIINASGWTSFSWDVSSLAGREVALSLELVDEDDGFDSRALVDNIRFISPVTTPPPENTVPEPGTLYLFAFGLLGLMGRVKKRSCS